MLATAYVDDVLNVTEQARTDFGLLLGRVAAHELGHLLMHTAEHARHGLMRAHSTLDEIRRNNAAEWEFTVADIAAMRVAGTPVEGAIRFTASPAGCL